MLIGGAYTGSRSLRLLRPVTLQKYNTLVDSFDNKKKKALVFRAPFRDASSDRLHWSHEQRHT